MAHSPRSFRSREGLIAILCTSFALSMGMGLATPREARAAGARASLAVHREVGAETCANTDELAALVESVAGSRVITGPEPKPIHLDVRIRREGGGYKSVIELSGARSGTRALDDEGPGCDVLSQALAVTISVLLDTAVDVEPPPPKPRAPEPPPPTPVLAPPPLPPKSPVPPLTITTGALFDFGTLDGSSGGFVVSAEAVIPIVSFGLSFVALPYAERARPSSLVVYRFLAGRARFCTRQPYLESFGASACGGLVAGARKAESRLGDSSFETDEGAYVAALLMIEVSRRIVGPVGLYADLGLTVPFFKEPIDVTTPGGLVVHPDDAAVTLQMGVGVRFWIEDPAEGVEKD